MQTQLRLFNHDSSPVSVGGDAVWEEEPDLDGVAKVT
jgi:hypothetical protein